MKKTIGFAIAVSILLSACASDSGGSDRADSASRDQSVQAPVAYFTGTGGKGMSLAILVPQGQGLPADQSYLPTMTQGVFVGDFSKYSAVSVLDRQNLDKVIAENYSGYYEEDHPDLNKLGHLLPTSYIMTGTITKTGSGYALQMQISDNQSGMTKASYSGTCTIAEFDTFTGIRRASADLLAQLGIALTEKAKQELAGASAAQYVEAQKTLAQGITSQQKGTVVEALSYYFQAAGYDPSLAEAASRLNIMSANISSGNIGQNARNDIQWRKDWIARLTEGEQFFTNYIKDNAPYYLVYSTDLQQGNINYQTETLSLSFAMRLVLPSTQWFDTLEKVLETVRQGLASTGRATAWGLNWPSQSVSGITMTGTRESPCMVSVELRNENGAVLGRQAVSLQYGYTLSSSYKVVVVPYIGIKGRATITFNAVKAGDITNKLSIVITGINGMNPETSAKQKHISILTDAEARQLNVFYIGNSGPAGGIVFYDKGAYSDGWRYLEAAPANTEFKATWDDAVSRCRSLVVKGYRGWRLPDIDELNWMYRNLHRNGLGGFSREIYWSSSENDSNPTWRQRFSDGSQDYVDDIAKYSTFVVRAIRAF